MKQNLSEFTVTRQLRWPDGLHIVEISQGGLDWSGSDCLCRKYAGEQETFVGMVEAVETAIEVAKQWQTDKPNEEIFISCGNTHGMGLSFEEQPLTEEVFAALRQEAKEFDEKLPKCCQCGAMLGTRRYFSYDLDEEEFCSEYCAEKRCEEWHRELDAEQFSEEGI